MIVMNYNYYAFHFKKSYGECASGVNRYCFMPKAQENVCKIESERVKWIY